MTGISRFAALAIVIGAFALTHPTQPQIEPEQDAEYVSRRAITCLTEAPNGDIWIGTTGGIVRFSPTTGATKSFSRADGLPANEITAIDTNGPEWTANCPLGRLVWNGTTWVKDIPGTSRQIQQTPLQNRKATTVRIRSDGMELENQPIPLPPGSGSHISTVTHGQNGEFYAAWFGDARIHQWDGKLWSSRRCDLPDGAGKEITALLRAEDGWFYIGTRRHGLYRLREGNAAQSETIAVTQEGPLHHNAQAIVRYNGQLFISTLEDGLSVLTAAGWEHVAPPTISSDAPRQMVVFQKRLYLRHGNGKVDVFDGHQWKTNIFADLPRKQASALASSGTMLYVAQWGGWSEWDGKQWSHHLNHPELQGIPMTALCPMPDGNTLWTGTQGRGLAEINIANGQVRRWHREQDGLTDDWITEIQSVRTDAGTRVLVGTFVGGLCEKDATGKWKVVAGTAGENVTGIAAVRDSVFVATRHGVRPCDGKEDAASAIIGAKTVEAQCLCAGEGGIYVGTRTGILYHRTNPSIENKKLLIEIVGIKLTNSTNKDINSARG